MVRRTILLCSFFLFSCPLLSMVCDNQFLPLFPRPFSRSEELPSRVAIDTFFTTAHEAYDDRENHINIPELYGCYDEDKLGRALLLVGKENPLPSEFRGAKIPWLVCNKIQTQSVGLAYEQKLFNRIYVGFSWFLMHMTSRHEFLLQKQEAGFNINQPGDILEIEDARRKMHRELGLCEAQSNRTGMGDFDLYLRVGNIWDYTWKCRKIDAGVSFGVMMPSGLSREVCNAATIPFGGNGHWGVYVKGDAEFELREDLLFGLSMRLNKRFKRTRNMRVPVAGEHPLFGALVTPISVDPGATFWFSPYVAAENLRGGLGARLGLNLTVHAEDFFCDVRSRQKREDLPADLKGWKKASKWSSDYISLNVFYDFGKVDVERNHKPIITFAWDIPYMLFLSSNNCRTHRITLGIEVNF